MEFGSKKFTIYDYIIKAQIWDTAGQERYRSLTNSYYKGAKGALVVCDSTRKSSLATIDKWIIDLKKNADENIMIMLISNKNNWKILGRYHHHRLKKWQKNIVN